MEFGKRPKEFLIGRYIYYKENLDRLPRVSYTHRNNKTILTIRYRDKSTGEIKKRRISDKNSDWEKMRRIADKRLFLKNEISFLENAWNQDYGGSIKDVSANYKIIKGDPSNLNMELWNSLANGQCPREIKHPFIYKGIKMRSQFETSIASVIDDMHIQFKYDTTLILNQGPVSPDFAMAFPEYDRCGFMEYLGALGSFDYIRDNADKFENYMNSGIYIGRDIIFLSGDKFYRPDFETIRDMIYAMIGEIARKCVIRIN
ncbi:MAG: hypothetical protein IJ757_03520 [Clostridiales bacterium]|nr:hypothetical protein [Clostridiales bacterium]